MKKENDHIVKTMEYKKKFLNAILNPPAPGKQLKKAQLNFKNFKETKGFRSRDI